MNFSKSAAAQMTRRVGVSSSGPTKSTTTAGPLFRRNITANISTTTIATTTTKTSLLVRNSSTIIKPISSTPSVWFSTATTKKNKEFDDGRPMNTPVPDINEEQGPTLLERSGKNVFQKMYDKYSFSQQTNRILMAESFLQAAISQASDP
jgi:hypothetical protein